jgi:hypothetical protein
MPSRFFTVVILLFWASSSGWFFFSELWPRIRGGDAPLFVIDLADEARRNSPPIYWDIIRGGKSIGQLKTTIAYRDADDSFDLRGTIKSLNLGKTSSLQVSDLENNYRVTREGKLLAVSAKMNFQVLQGIECKVELSGELNGNVFNTKLKLESPLINKEMALAPVTMTARGSALNPLHPVDRIHGLIPGKRWRIALVDPVRDALASLVPGTDPDVAYVQARVLPTLQTLNWRGQDRECYVIEYTAEAVEARTWVLARDGTVFRQEARFHEDEVILERAAN